MSRENVEKVGVIVIHGVGDSYPGWSETYLVPELERWAAYNNVKRVNDKPAGSKLVFVVPTADHRHLAVALEHDADFERFCRTVGLEHLIGTDLFRTTALRLKNRDLLAEYIGMVTSYQPADAMLQQLLEAGTPVTPAFGPQSKVHRVRDPESSDTTRRWQSFTRDVVLPGQHVTLCELFWADLSKSGTSTWSRFSALLQLVLEAPIILGAALLKGTDYGAHNVIARLVHFSNWLMRWPIAGLNVSIFVALFAMLALKPLGLTDYTPYAVTGTFLALMLFGLFAFRKWVHRKVGLAELALSTSIFSAVLLVLLALASIVGGDSWLASLSVPTIYLISSLIILLVIWFAWTLCNLAAILVFTMVAIKRGLMLQFRKRPYLPRTAAAIGLTVVVAMIAKFLLAVLGTIVLATADPPPGSNAQFQLLADDILTQGKEMLADIAIWNGLSIVAVGLAAAGVVIVRSLLLRFRPGAVRDGTLNLPRLVASPVILFTLFASAVGNLVVLSTRTLGLSSFSSVFRDFLNEHLPVHIDSFAAGVAIFFVFLYLIGRVVSLTGALSHIGRDLVDHQYDPKPKSLALLLSPMAARKDTKRFRRRQRIQRRLEALIEDVIVDGDFDRLIFLAHSQGTVIMHDYLLNHDWLVDDAHAHNNPLSRMSRIDALTLGSPLSHLYSYYFLDYEPRNAADSTGSHLARGLSSWTNMWRVDDPIGQRVDLYDGIENIGLGPGGHTFYWREDAVCERLWGLIANPPAVAAPVVAAEPGTAPQGRAQ